MSHQPLSQPSNTRVIGFIVILSFICALILALLASALKRPQEVARELDQSKQMLMAARIINPEGYFQVKDDNDNYVPAKLEKGGKLVPSKDIEYPSSSELFEVYRTRLKPMLVNKEGKLLTFKETGVNEQEYITENRKRGYYSLPLMLIYEILPNPNGEKEKAPIGYIIPVNGYGLWDAIYGYLAISNNGDSIIGISWYDQKETAGLGAVISDPSWQAQFFGKKIFQPGPEGETNFEKAPLGITVVRGKVSNVIGDKPKAESAVNGIPGATLTGNGVTKAYHDVLTPYRPFLIRIHKQNAESNGGKS